MRFLSLSPQGVNKKRRTVSGFRGVDLTSAPSLVELSRSPDTVNMVRDVPGRVRKRMGYRLDRKFPARINGVHKLRTAAGEKEVVHAGTVLYASDMTVLRQGLTDRRSSAFQIGEKLFIADGKELLMFDGAAAVPASENAYCPTLTIDRAPSGGGRDYEALNLLGGSFRELFLPDGTSTVYQLSMLPLDSDCVAEVRIMNAAGEFSLYTGAFTLNKANGTLTFASPPPCSPIDGRSSLEITAKKTVVGYLERINGCTVGAVFGVAGNQDRLFLSGNSACPNLDFHSGMDAPLYFPDDCYSRLGQESCAIAGYAVMGSSLITYKSRDDDGRNIVIRSGEMMDGKAAFPTVNMLYGSPAACSFGFVTANDEPLFLSEGGVTAITTADISGIQYTQNRSYYINRALTAEKLADACAVFYNDYCAVAAGDRLYLLDTLLREYQANAPYSHFQYECYLCEGISARVLFVDKGALCFGTVDGSLMRFCINSADPSSYSDCGRPIEAHWTTPDFSGDLFYKAKDITLCAVRMSPAPRTSLTASAKVRGAWREVYSEQADCSYLQFSSLVFSKLTFSCNCDPRTAAIRLWLKRLPCAALKFKNSNLNEPFSLLELALEYSETANLRRYK